MVAGEFLAAILITSTCSIILLAFGDECYHPASLGNPFFFFFAYSLDRVLFFSFEETIPKNIFFSIRVSSSITL